MLLELGLENYSEQLFDAGYDKLDLFTNIDDLIAIGLHRAKARKLLDHLSQSQPDSAATEDTKTASDARTQKFFPKTWAEIKAACDDFDEFSTQGPVKKGRYLFVKDKPYGETALRRWAKWIAAAEAANVTLDELDEKRFPVNAGGVQLWQARCVLDFLYDKGNNRLFSRVGVQAAQEANDKSDD